VEEEIEGGEGGQYGWGGTGQKRPWRVAKEAKEADADFNSGQALRHPSTPDPV